MKTSIKLLILLILVCEMGIAHSQVTPTDVKQRQLTPVGSSSSESPSDFNSGASFAGNNEIDLGEECNMYLNEVWQPGLLILKDQTQITGRQYRCNLYTRQMEFTDGVDTAAIGNPEDIDKLIVGNRQFVYKKVKSNENSGSGYFEVLVDGSYQLLCNRRINYKVMSDERDPLTGEQIEKYYMQKTLYYDVNHSEPAKLPSNRQEIIQLFDQQVPRLKSYLKGNKNKLRSTADIIDLFNYLNAHN